MIHDDTGLGLQIKVEPPNTSKLSLRIQCMKYLSSEVKFDLFEEYHGVKMSPRSHVPGMIHDSKALGL